MRSLLYSVAIVGTITLTLTAFAQQDPGQSLLWPTPEIHGTQRDLTHLPALPFFGVDPTNLQHQMWSQPGTGSIPHYGALPDLPKPTFYDKQRLFQSQKDWHPDTDAADRLLQKWRLDERDRTARI